MALATLANCLPRLIAALGANPSAWVDTVSGEVGVFPSDDEMSDALLLADGELITRGYFNSINNTLAVPFIVMSAPIVRGEDVPQHYGNLGKCEVSEVVVFFQSFQVNTNTSAVVGVGEAGGTSLRTGAEATFVLAAGATIPTGLVENTTYFVIASEDGDSFQVAATLKNALAGIPIAMTTKGTGKMFLIQWQDGVEAASKDDVTNMSNYAGDGALDFLWKIDQGNIYTTADFARIETPQYVRTAALQANEADEDIIVFLAAANLARDASPALFGEYSSKAEAGITQIIKDGGYSGSDENQ